MSVRPNIQFIDEDQHPPMYDLIIDLEKLSKWKTILNVHDKTVTIDHIELPMKSLEHLSNKKMLNNLYQEATEPAISQVATKQVTQILDAKYERANLPKVVKDNCGHLNVQQRNELLRLLIQHEELFGGALGNWQDKLVGFKHKPDAKPYHGRPFLVPQVHQDTIKNEEERLVEIGVLKPIQESEWVFLSFIIPTKLKARGKPGTVWFLSDLREKNKRVAKKPYPPPKISTILQELEGFQYATALDLNMGHYTLCLDLRNIWHVYYYIPLGKI